MKLLKYLVLGLLVIWPLWIATAQEPTPDPITIHVVQRDETLSAIALQYGVSIDDIIIANSILNADNLLAGQRLIIPSGGVPVEGFSHVVAIGQTIDTIAAQYGTTPEALSEANNILNRNNLIVGDRLQIPETGTEAPISQHVVLRGENLLRLAIRYQLSLDELAEFNSISAEAPLFGGQRLRIPNTNAGAFTAFPHPITAMDIAPLPLVQGNSVRVGITSAEGMLTNGQFAGQDIQFSDGQAIIGIHSFTEPGIYPLTINLPDGRSYSVRVRIQSGGYGSEVITIPPDIQDLLDPVLVSQELERVSAVMSGYTETRYFDGLMNLPATGAVTSQYGTRRSYNGSPLDTFHGGTDFGGAVGAIISAPATGRVVLADSLNVRGNVVILDHGWGVYTGYWHQNELFVQEGQLVERGEPLGTLGSTGLVTGAHLHWEMWVGGVQVNPMQWLTQSFTPVAE